MSVIRTFCSGRLVNEWEGPERVYERVTPMHACPRVSPAYRILRCLADAFGPGCADVLQPFMNVERVAELSKRVSCYFSPWRRCANSGATARRAFDHGGVNR
jgi:hypothetical protein